MAACESLLLGTAYEGAQVAERNRRGPNPEPFAGSLHDGVDVKATLRAVIRGECRVQVKVKSALSFEAASCEGGDEPAVFIFDRESAVTSGRWETFLTCYGSDVRRLVRDKARYDQVARQRGDSFVASVSFYTTREPRASLKDHVTDLRYLYGIVVFGNPCINSRQAARWLEASDYASCPILRYSGVSNLFEHHQREHHLALNRDRWASSLILLALPHAKQRVTIMIPQSQTIPPRVLREAAARKIKLDMVPLNHFPRQRIETIRHQYLVRPEDVDAMEYSEELQAAFRPPPISICFRNIFARNSIVNASSAMNPHVIEARSQTLNAALSLGSPALLVFDDNPLDALLYGAESAAPTPASVLDLWEQGLDRSESCARAVAAVLVQRPDTIGQFRDLDGAEQCLRQAIEAKPAKACATLAACWSGLGRIIELKGQKDTAEACYCQALELLESSPDAKPDTASQIALRLIQLLENSNRHEEAGRFRNRLNAESLGVKEDNASLSQLRATALDMFLAGQYTEAEAVYRRLVEKRFELGSIHCHLARVFLMTNREAEARQEVDRAWAVRHTSPAYLLVRIQFLRTLLEMLAGRDCKASLVEIQRALSEPGAHLDWTMQPVLGHLRPRIGPEQFELLTVMIAAAYQKSKLSELQVAPLWQEICGEGKACAAVAKEWPSGTGISEWQASSDASWPQRVDHDRRLIAPFGE
jgi:tetratricopeptide (TPR) repeat protein